jgi:hypothetical protein
MNRANNRVSALRSIVWFLLFPCVIPVPASGIVQTTSSPSGQEVFSRYQNRLAESHREKAPEAYPGQEAQEEPENRNGKVDKDEKTAKIEKTKVKKGKMKVKVDKIENDKSEISAQKTDRQKNGMKSGKGRKTAKDKDKKQEKEKGKGKGKGKGKRTEKEPVFSAEVCFEQYDNLFGLSEDQKTKLRQKALEDLPGQRFKNMPAISDFGVAPTVGMKMIIPDSSKDPFTLKAELTYHSFTKNTEASFPEGAFALDKSIGKNGTFRFDGKAAVGVFKKNYLSGVADGNSNGNITREERLYSSAIYREFEGEFSYETVVRKKKKQPLSRISLRPLIGQRQRRFHSGFRNRDYQLPFFGLESTLGFFSRLDLTLLYQAEALISPADPELFLYDETLTQTDVNGDGKIRANAPLLSKVDRSARRNLFEVATSWKPSSKTKISAEYSNRTASYRSNNPLDRDHFGRDGYRRRFKSGIKQALSGDFSAQVEFSQTENKDPDEDKYSEKAVLFSLARDFH